MALNHIILCTKKAARIWGALQPFGFLYSTPAVLGTVILDSKDQMQGGCWSTLVKTPLLQRASSILSITSCPGFCWVFLPFMFLKTIHLLTLVHTDFDLSQLGAPPSQGRKSHLKRPEPLCCSLRYPHRLVCLSSSFTDLSSRVKAWGPCKQLWPHRTTTHGLRGPIPTRWKGYSLLAWHYSTPEDEQVPMIPISGSPHASVGKLKLKTTDCWAHVNC